MCVHVTVACINDWKLTNSLTHSLTHISQTNITAHFKAPKSDKVPLYMCVRYNRAYDEYLKRWPKRKRKCLQLSNIQAFIVLQLQNVHDICDLLSNRSVACSCALWGAQAASVTHLHMWHVSGLSEEKGVKWMLKSTALRLEVRNVLFSINLRSSGHITNEEETENFVILESLTLLASWEKNICYKVTVHFHICV